jgi:superfamily II DNA or RNA helicase
MGKLSLAAKEELRQRMYAKIAQTPYLQKMRGYQRKGYVEIIVALSDGQRPIRQLCTGGGKSIEQACIVRTYYEHKLKLIAQGKPTGKILLVGEKEEIIVNALQQFKDIGIPESDIGIIKAGYKANFNRIIQIASVPTLAARWEKWDIAGSPIAKEKNYFDLVIIEECHHSASATTRELWRRYPTAKFVGWSATPEHKKGFVGQFDLIISGVSQKELAYMGYQPHWEARGILCPANFEKVEISNTGDFNPKALEKEIKTSNALLQGDILPTWKKWVADKYGIIPTILFARDVAESKLYAEEINRTALTINGTVIKAVHVDGKMSKGAIASALKQFVNGEATYLVNCIKLTEGFDLATYAKSLGLEIKSVGCVQDLAPTASIKKHKQKVGRARGFMHEGILKAVYLDHWGSHLRFYAPDSPWEWTLDGAAKAKGKPTKRCPEEDCDALGTWGCGSTDVDKDAARCPHCGFMFPEQLIKDERTRSSDDGDIQELDRSAELIPIQSDLEAQFEQLLSIEKRSGWAIGEFVAYAPDYQTLLAVQQRTKGSISDTFQYWLNGQRMKRNRYDWLPEFAEVLEILRTLTAYEQQGRFKSLEKAKPLHTYNSWLNAVRSLKGRSWLPTDSELSQIAEVCKYSPGWVFTQKRVYVR